MWTLYTKLGGILGFVISHSTIKQLKIASEINNSNFKKGILLKDETFTLYY